MRKIIKNNPERILIKVLKKPIVTELIFSPSTKEKLVTLYKGTNHTLNKAFCLIYNDFINKSAKGRDMIWFSCHEIAILFVLIHGMSGYSIISTETQPGFF